MVCLICHSLASQRLRYVASISDFHIINLTSSPSALRKARREAPRDLMPSMHVPATSSLWIIELGENSPADWSLIKRKVVVPGLSTACIGEEYIPGSKSGPKASE